MNASAMYRRALTLPAQPFEVARRVADRDCVALVFGATGTSYVLCDPADAVSALDPEPTLGMESVPHGRLPRWFGVLPYESQRSLERPRAAAPADIRPEPAIARPIWWRYRAAAVIHGERVEVVGEHEPSVQRLATLLERRPARTAIRIRLAEPPEPAALHVARIERALAHIRAGDLYQVNLARRQLFDVQGHPIDLLARLSAVAPAPYGAAFRGPEFALVSTSPELFLRLDAGGTVHTSPIKGTRPRGPDRAADEAFRAALDVDPKERAELAMVIDVERNDLGKVARPGSVRLSDGPRVHTYGTVHHRVATVTAELRRGVTRTSLLEAMLPSGSVTGAPKIRAMELIAELEAHRRGLYTGAFGVLCQDGGLELAMAIRTLTLSGAQGEYFAGGGIVADSDPLREVEETGWKAAQLQALLVEAG